MSDNTIKINVEADGIEEITEQVHELNDTMDILPSQVVIRNCRDCTINVYPSQNVWRGDGDETD